MARDVSEPESVEFLSWKREEGMAKCWQELWTVSCAGFGIKEVGEGKISLNPF